MSAIAGGFPASLDMFLNFLKKKKRFLVDIQPLLLPEHVEKLKHLEEVWINSTSNRPVKEAFLN